MQTAFIPTKYFEILAVLSNSETAAFWQGAEGISNLCPPPVRIPAANGARISELQGLLPKLRHPITLDRRCFSLPPRADHLERLTGLD